MTVTITAATNGIGLAAAKISVASGVDVAVVACNGSRAQQAVDQIAKAGDGRRRAADALIADLSSQEQVRTLAGETIKRYPRIFRRPHR